MPLAKRSGVTTLLATLASWGAWMDGAFVGRLPAAAVAQILPDRRVRVNGQGLPCCWSMKMSSRNWSVKMSSHEPTGDTHDESEGSPAHRAAESVDRWTAPEPGGGRSHARQ